MDEELIKALDRVLTLSGGDAEGGKSVSSNPLCARIEIY